MGLPQWVPGKPRVVLSEQGTLPRQPAAGPSAGEEAGPENPQEASRLEVRRQLEVLVRRAEKESCPGWWGRAGSTRTGDGSECKLDCDWDAHSQGSEKPMGWGTSRSAPGGNEAD